MFGKVLVSLAVILTIHSVTADRVQIGQCAGGLPMPEWVESTMCTADLCRLPRGQYWLGTAHFIAPGVFNTLHVDITVTFLGITIPVDIPPGYENACNFLAPGQSCPTVQGTAYTWYITAPIDPTFPLGVEVPMRSKLFIHCRIWNSSEINFFSLHSSCWRGRKNSEVRHC